MGKSKDSNEIREAFGYIRVSTEMQANNGRGLQKQIELVRNWARENGWSIPRIYEDIASAAHPQNLENRPDFKQAVGDALRAGVPLIVADATRLSRDLEILDRLVIKPGLTVISVEDDGEVPVGILRQRVVAGAERAKRISQGTKDALREGSKTKQLGSRTSLRKAANASARVRMLKKNVVLDQVVDVFVAHPDLRSATSREIADRLNQMGILTGWSRPWSASAVRGKMQEIESQLELRDQMAAEDAAADAFRPPMSMPGRADAASAATSSSLVLSSGPDEPDDQTAAVTLSEDDRKAEEELRKDPLFGMF